jgi:hypothetical protein
MSLGSEIDLPMTIIQDPAHFELESFRDLYAKAEYDLARLDKLVNSYDLFNFLCTIDHLHDWAEQDGNIPKADLPDNMTGVLNVVRLLCNRAKHFRKTRVNQKGKVLEAAPDTCVKKGYGMGRYGIGLYGVGEPSYTVDVDGTETPVLQLCKEAFAIWKKFMAQHP